MIKILLISITFLFIFNANAQEKQLTIEQKKKDFLHFHKILKENYPYFGKLKRMHKIYWLANKEKYLKQIENTKNDTDFVAIMNDILKELNDKHMDLLPTAVSWQLINVIENNLKNNNDKRSWDSWINLLKIAETHMNYWVPIMNSIKKCKSDSNSNDMKTNLTTSDPINYTDSITTDGTIAIMNIKTFLINMENDKPKIDSFLNRISECKYLIINIQSNSCGSSVYWSNNIIPRLLKDTVRTLSYNFMKDGAQNRIFYSYFFEESKHFSEANLTEKFSKIPPELVSENWYIMPTVNTFVPENPVKFNGKIYLLVDNKVFSSAEKLAVFCKTTGWAKIVGERTAGDGIGRDSLMILFPESKLLAHYPCWGGLNSDGSLNAEECTVPDIEIAAKTKEERLEKLLEMLKSCKLK